MSAALHPSHPKAGDGVALLQQARTDLLAGRNETAGDGLDRVLSTQPDNADALHLRGVVAWRLGSLGPALAWVLAALTQRPDNPPALNSLGGIRRDRGELTEAAAAFARAMTLAPGQIGFAINLSMVLGEAGRHDEAIAAARTAAERTPDAPEPQVALGEAWLRAGQPARAIEPLRRATGMSAQPSSLFLLGYALQLTGDHPAARTAYEAVLAQEPNHDRALQNISRIHEETGSPDQAEACLRRALELAPGKADNWANLAIMLRRRGDLAGALQHYDRAIVVDPHNARTRYHHALTLLLSGDFTRGWRAHEWRSQVPDFPIRTRTTGLIRPDNQWDGTPLAGRTLFLHAEQGLGDTIQFVRYAPLIGLLGLTDRSRVLLMVQPALERWFEGLPGVTELVSHDAKLPAFDVHAPLLSLPLLLGTTGERIPAAVPYLRADPAAVAHWGSQFGDGLRIGFTWAGNPRHPNDHHRSLAPEHARRIAEALLASRSDLTLVGLQVGDRADDLANLSPARYRALGADLGDFAQTAAAICAMDAVVSVDSAVAHAAGALARPGFVLLPAAPDWRWLQQGDRSAWYPTLRLCRAASEPGMSSASDRALHAAIAAVGALHRR